MKRTPSRPVPAPKRAKTAPAQRPSPPPAEPATPLSHPAMIAALAVAAACAVISVTFTLWDTDLWHHLLVGRVIWQEHAVPTKQLWSWPTYGAPDANSAWLFRALIWPLWSAAEVPGLFVWRWAAVLAALALVAAGARRMGARGFAPVVVLVLAALLYRLRSQLRPDTMAAVLLALAMFVLERRRQTWLAGAIPGRGAAIALVAIAWVWANTHPSWYLGFVLLGVWWLDESLAARGRRAAGDRAVPRPGVLLGVIAAAAAISFLNPFGWRALWLPFDFFLNLRHELMYRTIKELGPVDWRLYVRSALPLFVAGWPLLILWRARRRRSPEGRGGGRVDRVEIALCLLLTPMALSAVRFIVFYVIAASPFVMRDLSEWASARRWPRWTAPAWTRAAITITLCAGAAALEWNRPGPPLGIGIQWDKFPVAAADYLARQGIRGRGFNNFEYGAYQAWRFWPDRGRLPFMTGTPEVATREDRLLYAGVFARPEAWRALDAKYRFDYILVDRVQTGDNHLLDRLDADTTWALVFADDAAAVYVRRDGPHARLAADSAYRLVPGGSARLNALGAAVTRDPAMRARAIEELERQVASSPWSAHALGLLANVALVERRHDEARALLGRALAIEPALGRGHERLGLIALEQGRPREALAEFERERALNPQLERLALRMGQAYQALGDAPRAREWYRRELAADPGNAEARDSLAALDRRGGGR